MSKLDVRHIIQMQQQVHHRNLKKFVQKISHSKNTKNLKIIGRYYINNIDYLDDVNDYEIIEIYKIKNKDKIKVIRYYIDWYDIEQYNNHSINKRYDKISHIININDLYENIQVKDTNGVIYSVSKLNIYKTAISINFIKESDLIEEIVYKDIKSIIVEYMDIFHNLEKKFVFLDY